MSNVLVTSSIVAKRALPILENMLTFAKACNREYQEEFDGNMSRGYAPGVTINIKKPPRYMYRAGAVANPQATVETTVPLTLSQGGCDIALSSLELTLSVTQLDKKIAAAIAPVANEIDRQGLALAHFATFNTLNPAGAQPSTQALSVNAIATMQQRLNEMAAPVKDNQRALVMNPSLQAALLQGYSGMFNKVSSIGDQNTTGAMNNQFGLNPDMDQNVDVHTNGTQVVTGTNVNAANQIGSNIVVVGLGGTITRGTVITLPGVFAVNPQSRTTTGTLAQFVVTADCAAAATTIPVSPALVTSGAFQNVTASPTNGQPFLIVGAASTAYATNVAFHSDAFTLAMVPMWSPGPKGVISVEQMTHNGFTVKVTQFYDGINDKMIMRIDVLFGYAATYPELAVKYYTLN